MKYLINLLLIFLICFISQSQVTTTSSIWGSQLKAPSQPVTETYFGKEITDPYRNLENLKDSAVLQWMKAQSDYTNSVLKSLPSRQQLLDMMKDFDNRKSARISELSITGNDIYYYIKILAGEETGKLYMRNGLMGNEILLFDPADYNRKSSKKYVVHNINPTDEGSLVTFKVTANGSENNDQLIMDVKEKKIYPEKIERTVLAVSWLPDNSGFLYSRYQLSDVFDKERMKNSNVYLHKPGTDPFTDKEFLSRADYPDLGMPPGNIPRVIYDQGSHFLFALIDGWSNSFYAPASELKNPKINWKRLFTAEDQVESINVTGKELFVRTSKNAPHGQIIKTSLQNPDLTHATVVIPQDAEATITSFKLTNGALYYTVIKNGVEAILYRLPNGSKKATRLELPFAAGTISLNTKETVGKGGGARFPEIWVTLSGWTSETKRYRYLPDKNEFRLEQLTAPGEFPELADLTVEELMVTSHDGVKIPLSLVYKRGLKKDGSNPVGLMGYGAYGASQSPGFGPPLLAATTKGIILAVAHVRGGGELGEQWHKAGFKTTKPNTWMDVISCAEYLIDKKYTSPGKLILSGGSAGGILVGRAMTERPDLFAVAIPEVGMMNTVRFEESPNGPGNVHEFGTVKDSLECMALIEMDSYLHLRTGVKYPATLITAGMNDPRVIVWQPAKFAARLQEVNASNKPVLLRVDYASGHGKGDMKSVSIERMADLFSFALWQTGHPDFQIKGEKKGF